MRWGQIGRSSWLSRSRLRGREVWSPRSPFLDNFKVAYKLRVVNTPFPTNVYDLVGILREWPGPATEETCSRQA